MMKSEEEVKVTFLGDITCDRPMLKAARRADGSFNFLDSFSSVSSYLRESDLVVGNLETVFGGKTLGYNPGPVTYNCPDDLAEALKMCGITVLTTANNHCLDCGSSGINRTINVLDQVGLEHTGTWPAGKPISKRYLVLSVGGINISVVSYADSVNSRANGTVHNENELLQVNVLRDYSLTGVKAKLKNLAKQFLPMERMKAASAERKRSKDIKLIRVYSDDYDVEERDKKKIETAIECLKAARKESDFVILCVHCGGQFNEEPGKHSRQLHEAFAPYADVIIGNHAHVVQPIEVRDDLIDAYCLGGLNISPSADYINPICQPEHSVGLNLYLKKDAFGNVEVSRKTFTVFRAAEDKDAYVRVNVAGEAEFTPGSDAETVYRRFCGREYADYSEEFEL